MLYLNIWFYMNWYFIVYFNKNERKKSINSNVYGHKDEIKLYRIIPYMLVMCIIFTYVWRFLSIIWKSINITQLQSINNTIEFQSKWKLIQIFDNQWWQNSTKIKMKREIQIFCWFENYTVFSFISKVARMRRIADNL